MKISVASLLQAATAAFLALSTVQVQVVQAAAVPSNLQPSSAMAAASMAQTMKLQKRGFMSGVNDFNCKLTPDHPRPLLLVHATLLTKESWWTFAPVLVEEGYCVFALTYGRYKDIPLVGGLAPIAESAKEVADFGDEILTRMNVTQLDYVGHSQGGILGRYWVKHLGGAGKINKMVGISPIHHGTTLSGITTIAKALKIFNPAQPVFDFFAPSFFEMVDSSEFMAKLNEGSDILPGVTHANIATKFDEVVTPWGNCYQKGQGAVNKLLQDFCGISINEHLTMINSKVVLRFVMNQLRPSTASSPNCLSFLWLR
ncbi:MAG: Alpha/Beta hydrolase protein [Benniella sp.]|nr:MAG: Alpha/Beta hydrolase protein [Benniella sp.]